MGGGSRPGDRLVPLPLMIADGQPANSSCLQLELQAVVSKLLLMLLPQEEKDPGAQKVLLRKWAKLHHGRTVLSLSAFAAMIAAVVGRL